MTSTNQKVKSNLKKLDEEAKKIGMGGNLIDEKNENVYKERMKHRKEIQSKRLEKRDKEKSLIIIFTGNGKGKTTAALGMALRTLGYGHSIAIIQFIKGGWSPGEEKALSEFSNKVKWHAFGEGFTWETQNRLLDKQLVEKSWEKALCYLVNSEYKLVILDEINIAIKLGYISEEQVLEGIKKRPKISHVVLTGRGASKSLIENADLVTEMKLLKHPFREQGVKAQIGVEF